MATVTTMTPEQRAAIFARCERFVSGHGMPSAREMLVELAAEATPDDEADRYGAGETVTAFERQIAALLGKEAAVFLPTGTMAQQIALRIWSERTGRRTVAFHPMCHLETHEEKAYQVLHGLRATLVGDARRLLTTDDLRAVAEPVAALLLELPQRDLGGQLPPWDDLLAQAAWAKERGAALHMDGARLWEAGPFYDRPYAAIAAPFESVYVSFYKGIGAITGAALAGSADFVAEACVWQKRHGGTLLHIFPYVLSARQNLRTRLDRFPAYTARARRVAAALRAIPGVRIAPDPPQTRMMHVFLPGETAALLDGAAAIARTERVALFQNLRATDVPGYCAFEMNIGDAADALTDAEIHDYFARVVTG